MKFTYAFDDLAISDSPEILVDGTVEVTVRSFENNPIDPQEQTEFEFDLGEVKLSGICQYHEDGYWEDISSLTSEQDRTLISILFDDKDQKIQETAIDYANETYDDGSDYYYEMSLDK